MSLFSIKGMHAGYGARNVLHGIDLDVEERQIQVVLGANGAGKTTLLRAISGTIAREGTILFDGAREIEDLAVDLGRNGRVCQAWTDAPGDIEGAGLGRDGLLAAVGQSDFDVTHREFSA